MIDNKLLLNFHGARLEITAAKVEWISLLKSQFGQFIEEPCKGIVPSFYLSLQMAGVGMTCTTTEPLVYSGLLPDGNNARITQGEGVTTLFLDDEIRIVIDYTKHQAAAWLTTHGQHRFFGTALMTVVAAVLSAENQQLVHAASLLDRTGKAVLFCVRSGGGKTTTSLALARDGFALLTDDASVLKPMAGGFVVWGLQRPLKVHRHTVEMLPWLPSLHDEWDINGEKAYSLDSLTGFITIAPPVPAKLGAILLIGERSQTGHTVSRASKADVMIALAHDNVGVSSTGMAPKALASFRTIAQAVQSVPCLVLSAGSDLTSLPLIVEKALFSERVNKQ